MNDKGTKWLDTNKHRVFNCMKHGIDVALPWVPYVSGAFISIP